MAPFDHNNDPSIAFAARMTKGKAKNASGRWVPIDKLPQTLMPKHHTKVQWKCCSCNEWVETQYKTILKRKTGEPAVCSTCLRKNNRAVYRMGDAIRAEGAITDARNANALKMMEKSNPWVRFVLPTTWRDLSLAQITIYSPPSPVVPPTPSPRAPSLPLLNPLASTMEIKPEPMEVDYPKEHETILSASTGSPLQETSYPAIPIGPVLSTKSDSPRRASMSACPVVKPICLQKSPLPGLQRSFRCEWKNGNTIKMEFHA